MTPPTSKARRKRQKIKRQKLKRKYARLREDFAFSHPAYRVTRGGGFLEFTGGELGAHVLREFADVDLVINPAGPGTCRLTRGELAMLAESA
jgi:hypothetical protein